MKRVLVIIEGSSTFLGGQGAKHHGGTNPTFGRWGEQSHGQIANKLKTRYKKPKKASETSEISFVGKGGEKGGDGRRQSLLSVGLNVLLDVLVADEVLLVLVAGGSLVLLVLRDEIVHVGLGLSELELLHTLTNVPVKESLAAEHGSELLRDTLEEGLDGSVVTDEGGGHLETDGGDVSNGRLDVVGDPLDEVGRRFVLDEQHLVIDFLGGHLSTEHDGGSEVLTAGGVAGSHHVALIEHLGDKLGNARDLVVAGGRSSEGSETNQEEVETREGDQVDRQLSQISVQLSREAERAGNSGHNLGDQVVQISVRRRSDLQSAEADIVQGLVINAEDLIGGLNQLMARQSGIVGLHNGVRNLGGRDDGEGAHHAVGELLADARDQQGSHTRTSSSSQRVADLETLEGIASLDLLTDDVHNAVDQLVSFSVVTY